MKSLYFLNTGNESADANRPPGPGQSFISPARTIIFFIILLAMAVNVKPANAQVSPFLLWSRLYDSTYFSLNRYWVQDDDPMASVTDSQGNTYVAIRTYELGSSANGYGDRIIKYDSEGKEQLLAGGVIVGGSGGWVNDMVVDNADNLYLTGYVYLADGYPSYAEHFHISTAKVAPDGTIAWRVVRQPDHDPPANYDINSEFGVALELDSNGNVYVAGQVASCPSCNVASTAVIKYDNNGFLQWEKISYTETGLAQALALDSGNNVYALGHWGSIKYDASGNTICSTTTTDHGGSDIDVDGQGNYYVAGTVNQGSYNYNSQYYVHTNFETRKYDANCNEVWSEEYDADFDDDQPQQLIFADNGSIYVMGEGCSGARYGDSCSSRRFVTLRYDSDGNRLWAARSEDGSDHKPIEMVIDGAGNAYVTGNREDFDSTDFLTVKFSSADGNEDWQIIANGQDITARNYRARVCCLGIDSEDSIFVIARTLSQDLHGPASNWDMDSATFKYTELEDFDGDGIPNISDNCISVANSDQTDTDGEGVGDACDNCPDLSNLDQADGDEDGAGDACDNCKAIANSGQEDADNDDIGDVCDNCPDAANENQTDGDGDRIGDICDNCPDDRNRDQVDSEGDGIGDACDNDDDNDGISDEADNCRIISNIDQRDLDGDGVGDACNDAIDKDHDEWSDELDNCPDQFNQNQNDINADGIGDACAVDLRPGQWEVVQVIQDLKNSVPLVRGKPTWVRVYVKIGDVPDTVSINNVTGKLIGFLSDGSTSEIYPEPRFITARLNPDRGKWEDSLNFLLPEEWISPHSNTATFYIEVNPDRTVDEIDYTNNRFGAAGTRIFYRNKPLNVMFVPVRVKINGTWCDAPDWSDFDTEISWLKKVHPVSEINPRKYSPTVNHDDRPKNFDNGETLMMKLVRINTLHDDPLADMKYYGLICSNASLPENLGGLAFSWSDEAWGSPSQDGLTMAHEIGHLLGRDHAPTVPKGQPINNPDCSPDQPKGPDWNFPLVRNSSGILVPGIREYGFDGIDAYDPDSRYDFMAYCWPRWVSPYTYNALFTEYHWGVPPSGVGGQAAQFQLTGLESETEYIVVIGMIRPDGTVFSEFRVLSYPSGTDDEPGTGGYSLELQDTNGTALFVRYFDAQDTTNSESLYFSEKIPFNSETARILIKQGTSLLETIAVSKNKPAVTVTFPNGGENLSGVQTISWTATDADDDPLTFDVFYSAGGGSTWSLIASGLNQNSFEWITDWAPGSSQALIRVSANDGVNTGRDESDSFFSVAKKSPVARIIAPENNAVFALNEIVFFEGAGYDLEDVSSDEISLTWSSSVDGPLGSGRTLSLANLSAGSHTITLLSEDSDNNTGSASITITVMSVPDSDGDKVGDDVDNCPLRFNPDQKDTDGDQVGDKCDDDDEDNDGFPDNIDNCRLTPNDQRDLDEDGIGDGCDNQCEGDLDHDRDVDGPDLSLLAGSFGQTDCTGCVGDINGDGDVDGTEMAIIAFDIGRHDCPISIETCSGALYYDTETAAWHWAVNPNYGIAVRFTPPSYPWIFNLARFWPWSNSGSLEVEVHVWDDEGLGGLPGNDLITPFAHGFSGTDSWQNVDLPASIRIDSGEFYIGWIQTGSSSALYYNASDDATNSEGRSYVRYLDGTWKNFLEIGQNDNMMIRQDCQNLDKF